MPKHAVLSPSAAHRWLECTPSARLEESFPATTSDFAEEGTAAHQLAELCASYAVGKISEKNYSTQLKKLQQGKWYTEEMMEACQGYADLIRKKSLDLAAQTGDAEVLLETSLRFSEWVPDSFGTADCLIMSEGHLEVIDFKYGKGKRVSAYGNPQMQLYALGAYATFGLVYEPDVITMTIYQPRIMNGITTDEITLQELLDWADTEVRLKAQLAFNGEGEYNPGPETCKFCRAKATCKARAEENLKLFEDSPDAFLLTLEEAGQILERASDIKTWLSDLEKYVFGALMNGDPVPGWKLVEGRSTRRFSDPAAVARKLEEAGYDPAVIYKPRELITLTQMEKDLGKKAVAETLGDLIIKPAGAPALVPEYDKRPEIQADQDLLKQFDN